MYLTKHFKYLSYVVRHKWFVLIAGFKINAPIIRLLLHDMSKFRPREWFAYVDAFYGEYGYNCSNEFYYQIIQNRNVMQKFDLAWLLHQHRNPHHWQYWVLREDRGKVKKLEMPYDDILEMVADWMGAGRAITGKWEAAQWYKDNKKRMTLHERTAQTVEIIFAKEYFKAL
jgi:hypothetical protein